MRKEDFRKILIQELGHMKVLKNTGFLSYKEVIKAVNNSLKRWDTTHHEGRLLNGLKDEVDVCQWANFGGDDIKVIPAKRIEDLILSCEKDMEAK